MAKIFIGTSGWDYVDWVGVFYLKDKGKLEYYSKVFNTAEIDSTFYDYPIPRVVESWVKRTPRSFVFAAKVPRTVTHKKMINPRLDIAKDLELFLNLMKPLAEAGKMGPLLFQLPPGLKYDLDRLEALLANLPTKYKFAVEFRDPSWLREETYSVLEKYEVAYTIVDEPLLPPECIVTANFAYIRWHGRGQKPWYNYHYKREELEAWIPKVKEVEAQVSELYGYFNNHFHGYACDNALTVLEMLGILTLEQAEAKKRLSEHFKAGKLFIPPPASAKLKGLQAYMLAQSNNPSDLIMLFTDEKRIKRSQEIPTSEVLIEELTDNYVKAKVKDYVVVVDGDSKVILHDCADFSRVSTAKQFCKHLARLFTTMPQQTAVKLLKKIHQEIDEWTFKPLVGEEGEQAESA
ncbi:MAG: hypothetical protein DRJ33_01255 [Candidatus Methanomethylicota archaeon]|mgnify:CR=1 FL=1|uniref:DUF72 domain-containing protein n=1 Tax=Thermoproteota archaeon TaxID=2056631 RepID=A0A497F136_9CREN|nr:MAG: hypothetical protein DRJ33_01255 [Candidatus Verstraetearchaeota archaeon]